MNLFNLYNYGEIKKAIYVRFMSSYIKFLCNLYAIFLQFCAICTQFIRNLYTILVLLAYSADIILEL